MFDYISIICCIQLAHFLVVGTCHFLLLLWRPLIIWPAAFLRIFWLFNTAWSSPWLGILRRFFMVCLLCGFLSSGSDGETLSNRCLPVFGSSIDCAIIVLLYTLFIIIRELDMLYILTRFIIVAMFLIVLINYYFQKKILLTCTSIWSNDLYLVFDMVV